MYFQLLKYFASQIIDFKKLGVFLSVFPSKLTHNPNTSIKTLFSLPMLTAVIIPHT